MTDADRERTSLTDTIITLSKEPYPLVNWLKHNVINGLKFKSSNVETNRKTQNNEVSVVIEGGNTFYGVLTNIIELNYSGNIKHVLFKCTWVDDQNRRRYKTDEFRFSMVNFTHFIHGGEKIEDEPYVLASQATQVFLLKIKGTKIGMLLSKLKPEMCLTLVLAPIVMRMTRTGFMRIYRTV